MEDGCTLGTGRVERSPALLAELINARWVAELLGEPGRHRTQHVRVDRCRGGVIEVDRIGFDLADHSEKERRVALTGDAGEIGRRYVACSPLAQEIGQRHGIKCRCNRIADFEPDRTRFARGN